MLEPVEERFSKNHHYDEYQNNFKSWLLTLFIYKIYNILEKSFNDVFKIIHK